MIGIKMNKFKVGDRVNIYFPEGIEKNVEITGMENKDYVLFRGFNDVDDCLAHYKQCRKVVRKKKISKNNKMLLGAIDNLTEALNQFRFLVEETQ